MAGLILASKLAAAPRCAAFVAAASPRLAAPLLARRGLYVKVESTPSAAFEKLALKVEREGIDRMLQERRRYMKPTLRRQKNAKDAVYNRAKRTRMAIIERIAADTTACPF